MLALVAAICILPGKEALQFEFPGGSQTDLVRYASKHFSAPVMLFSEPQRQLPDAKFEYESNEVLLRQFRTNFGLEIKLERESEESPIRWAAVYPASYHPAMLNSNQRNHDLWPDDSPLVPPKQEIGGAISFNMREPARFALLADQGFAEGKLSVFPLYPRAQVIGHGTFKSRSEMYHCLAATIGARYDTKTGIDLDYNQFKSRCLAMGQRTYPNLPQHWISKIDYQRLVLGSLMEHQVREVYTNPMQLMLIAIDEKSPAGLAAKKYMEEFIKSSSAASNLHESHKTEGPYSARVSGAAGVTLRLLGRNGEPPINF
ncbi:hypothetical protein QPK87_37360 [Kamptonema cortianum]|nr:hypothetical protein [Geitlerinema splendidum]MDK3162177.1 hypothetical protein [Kamptonema cortianum]